MRIPLTIAGLLCLGLALGANPAAGEENAAQGASADEFIPRLQGLEIVDYNVKDLDRYTLPTGRLIKGQAGTVLQLEGKVTGILYKAPVTKSTFEIGSYYEIVLENHGFTILFKGDGEDLGDWPGVFYKQTAPVHGEKENQWFVAGKLARETGDVYAAVYATLGWNAYAMVKVDIIEMPGNGRKAAAGQPATAVEDTSLEDKLVSMGRAIVPGIEFQEGSAELKPGSEPALKAIAAFMKKYPYRTLALACYTDSIGDPEYCQAISSKRAETVFRAVVFKYGADKNRITAEGKGWVPQDSAFDRSSGEKAYGNRIEVMVVE